MKRRDIVKAYRNNTSNYSKLNNYFSKLDWIVTPICFAGLFLGGDFIKLLSIICLLIFATVQLCIFLLDAVSRVKKH